MELFPMARPAVVQIQRGAPLDLANYVALAVMYGLGSHALDSSRARLIAAALCIGFALTHALVFPKVKDLRTAAAYFTLQTLLVTSLLLLSLDDGEFFGFLFYILAVTAATSLPGRAAAGWIALFFVIILLINGLLPESPRFVLISFTGAVLILCGLFGRNLRETELARRHNQALLEELAQTQQRLQALTLAEERNRLAREIHDGLGHYLTATTMQIQGARAVLESQGVAAQAPAALEAIGKAETLLQEALADVRRSVAALRAASGDERPLADRIGELVAGSRTPGGLEADFVLLGRPRLLNPQAELTLYRVAQEGLTNVRKHAQAHRVEITLAYAPETVGLTVVDDGQGMAANGAEGRNGYGLLGLQERVQLLGGALQIDAASGQGVRLKVELPG
jgi:signal transduction histidine kinase